MRILVVEDDALLGDGIQVGLKQDAHAVDWVRTGEHALAAVAVEEFDLIILDIGLPGKDGFAVLRELRRGESHIPVIILTARDALPDRVHGLDLGADDYLTKPFDLEELCARVRAVLRRSSGKSTPSLTAGRLELDPASHRATLDNRILDLPPKEFALLRLLMANKGKVLTKSRLQGSLYGWSDDVASNALEVHIHHLRRKLGADSIRTVRGIGYMLVMEE